MPSTTTSAIADSIEAVQPFDLLEKNGTQRVFISVTETEKGTRVLYRTHYYLKQREYSTPLRKWLAWQQGSKLVRRMPQEFQR
ncbi:MAG: hypothetical protein ACREJD_09470 [Phycisphaerales bacterium]